MPASFACGSFFSQALLLMLGVGAHLPSHRSARGDGYVWEAPRQAICGRGELRQVPSPVSCCPPARGEPVAHSHIPPAFRTPAMPSVGKPTHCESLIVLHTIVLPRWPSSKSLCASCTPRTASQAPQRASQGQKVLVWFLRAARCLNSWAEALVPLSKAT